eukprot:CAMPEP_0202712434 /NCGR_PEP_ID=MMETSP1385-20130828/39703_1 /ASSEMBLY_ACC=CAM_ASM_000861 /TAXON_ID=933848 /ORGANISM="Elphidium margaritaceum" /LENGTH=256 /DNA_ID=CAMNT_0049372465 /DNA_START=49 /DNA_END=816 /DNA_ORIENTATION=-
MGMCCCSESKMRRRSVSDPAERNKTKFSAVNKTDDLEDGGDGDGDGDMQTTPNPGNVIGIKSSSPTPEPPGGDHESIVMNLETAHKLDLAQDVQRRFSQDFEAKLITIHIEMADGERKALPIMNSLTVSQMKTLVAKHVGVAEPRQCLKYNDMVLDANQLMSTYNICDGDTIQLKVLQDSDILQLSIDYKNGTIKKEIFCTPHSKLIDFRKEVQGKIPTVALNEQQFFYQGQEMTDDEKLMKDYGIETDAVIQFEW